VLNTVFKLEVLDHLQNALGRDLVIRLFVVSESNSIHSVGFLDGFVQVVLVKFAVHATVPF
jgi:hypothetical protein